MPAVRILHLDEDKHDALAVAYNVRSAGLNAAVTHVSTGEAYTAALARADVGLILAHGPVAGLTGLAALQLARRHLPGVPVIVLLDEEESPRLPTLRQAGASDCVPRHDWPRLMAAIGRVVIAAA